MRQEFNTSHNAIQYLCRTQISVLPFMCCPRDIRLQYAVPLSYTVIFRITLVLLSCVSWRGWWVIDNSCFWTADVAEILSCTVKSLKEGHVVAVPTDTIYGLACLAQSSEAIRKTYDIKGRHQQKPLAICVGEIQDIYKWVFVRVSAGENDELIILTQL